MEKENKSSITQVRPQNDFVDTKNADPLLYEYEKKQEELSKTQKFRLLNEENPSPRLGDTIKIKLSEIKEKIEEEPILLPKKKKSLYDTVIIKLDDLINRKNAIKYLESKKVASIEEQTPKKKSSFSSRNKLSRLNVDSEDFGRELYHLNKMALENLSFKKQTPVRKNFPTIKLKNMENVLLSEENYQKYKKDLNRFAINKLYYKMAPKETKKYKIYKYSLLLTSIFLVVSSFLLVNWFIQGRRVLEISHSLEEDVFIKQVEGGELFNISDNIEHSLESIEETNLYWKYKNTPFSSVDFREVKENNSDTIGWLIVPNTNVNYPVVQTNDNEYYLKHSFDKTVNQAGWVFADFRNTFTDFSDNTVIYAHGRKDKVMFGSLTNALDPSWYSVPENQMIQFSTEQYNTVWQIFSIYKIEAESYYITTDFSSKETLFHFATIMKNRSIYDFGVPIYEGDKFLTLSTCYNDRGIRLVIQAKLVKMQKR